MYVTFTNIKHYQGLPFLHNIYIIISLIARQLKYDSSELEEIYDAFEKSTLPPFGHLKNTVTCAVRRVDLFNGFFVLVLDNFGYYETWNVHLHSTV